MWQQARRGRRSPWAHPVVCSANVPRPNPNFFVSLASTAHGHFLPQTGAVLIKDESGHVIGAVGASGGTGDEDEAICIAGVEAVGLQAG